MVDSIISPVDDAPWLHRQETGPDQPRELGQRFIGDLDSGPWIYVNSLEPDRVVPPHVHTEDEVMIVLDGELRVGDRVCGPGTVVFNRAHNEYGFTVGSTGVRFINIRSGLAEMAVAGKKINPWAHAERMDPTSQ